MPEINVDYNASSESLRCEAPRWFPQPTVAWASQVDQGANFSEVSNTSFELNSENVTMKVVSVLYNVTINNTYSCMIENDIAKATGDIKVTGGSPGVSRAAGDETQGLGGTSQALYSQTSARLSVFSHVSLERK
jgi:hypothetical protein